MDSRTQSTFDNSLLPRNLQNCPRPLSPVRSYCDIRHHPCSLCPLVVSLLCYIKISRFTQRDNTVLVKHLEDGENTLNEWSHDEKSDNDKLLESFQVQYGSSLVVLALI